MGIKNAIKLPKHYEALLDDLTTGDDAPFNAMYEVVIFAAALGFHEKATRAPTPPWRTDSIAAHLFSDDTFGMLYDNIVLLSALDEEVDDPVAEVFGENVDSGFGLKIFTQYICGGLDLIDARRSKRHTYSAVEDFSEWIDDLLEELSA